MDKIDATIMISLGLALCIMGCVLECYMMETRELRQQAIEKGHAYYHPKTGEWTWIKGETK